MNHSDAPVRYLVVSTTNRPDVVEYPDGATLVVLAGQRLAYPHGADVDQSPSGITLGVIQARRRLRLAQEALAERVVGAQIRREHFSATVMPRRA